MARILAAIIACGLAVAFGATASAQLLSNAPRIFSSGRVYHIAACPGPAPIGSARCHAHIVTDRVGRPLVNQFVPNVIERTARSNLVPQGFGPMSLVLRYNSPVATTYPVGVGSPATVIAIVDAHGYTNAEADLQVYRNTFHLPACTTANGCFRKFNQQGVQGNYPPQDLGWAQESALDLDMASAMCPNCKIILVEAANASSLNLALSVRRAVLLGAHVVSNSYGGSEVGSATLDQYYNHPGVAITASTGDNGYDAGPNFPATSEFVTAVGGTSLTFSRPTGFSETAWVDGGSGCSKIYPKPAWQAFINLCTKRMEADVSAVADPDTGVAIYGPVNASTSAWQVFGGTSAAAPLVGGLYGANGGKVTLGSVYGATVRLWDVTTGVNGTCGGIFFCKARRGYDGPTGLGTPTSKVGF